MKKLIYIFAVLICFVSIRSQAQVNVQLNGGMRYSVVQCNGSAARKFDIVFMGDGFTADEQALFDSKVEEAVNAMRARQPFSDNMCAFNIWKINVISAESGIDHPIGSITRNNELHCTYGDNSDGNPERLITVANPANANQAAGYAPGRDAVYILINDPMYGGGAGAFVTSYCGPSMPGVVTHELGHFVGSLADEYNYGFPGTYPWGEPSQANATIETNPASIKWRDLIPAGTPIPTVSDNPAGVVGLFEGAVYHATGVYRPVMNCHMRDLAPGFCPVCDRELRTRMRPHCTECERDPNSFACIWQRLRPINFIDWRIRIRWPWPPCLTCPPLRNKYEEIEIVLEGLEKEKFILSAVDINGKEIGRGEWDEKGRLVLRAETKDRENTFIQLSPASEKMTKGISRVKISASINGETIALQ